MELKGVHSFSDYLEWCNANKVAEPSSPEEVWDVAADVTKMQSTTDPETVVSVLQELMQEFRPNTSLNTVLASIIAINKERNKT